jgi:hypothetical protein
MVVSGSKPCLLAGDPFDFLSNVPALLSSLPSCSLLRQLYRYLVLSKIE